MKRIGRRARILIVVAIYFLVCSTIFLVKYGANASTWVMHPANQDVYRNGELINGGSVYSKDGTLLYQSTSEGSVYAEDMTTRLATLHAIGDTGDNINTGVIKTFRSTLVGYDWLNGVYNPFDETATIHLTLDAETCATAYEALGNYNGTVGIYNYRTGEIICMVSKSSFDPENPPDTTTEEYEGVYINRLTNGVYAPGSIMKLTTSLVAIETLPDIYSRTYTCNGGITINGEWIACTGNHGTLGFERAVQVSCNAAFATISNEVGAEALTTAAETVGITKNFEINGITTSKGVFDVSTADANSLGWAGIGQYTDMVNPMQYLIFMGAVAGGGEAVTPYYVDNVTSSYGLPSYLYHSSTEDRMFSQASADALKALMRNNVLNNYGEGSLGGYNLCGKTGTAQTTETGGDHAWFVGFLDSSEAPLAFVTIVEHGGYGSQTARPVAEKALLQAIESLK